MLNFEKRALADKLKKAGVKTAKKYGLVTYLKPEEFTPYFDSENCKYAYILHDKDDSEPHFHIAVAFKYDKSPSFIGDLPQTANTRIKNVFDLQALTDYLTHANNPEKHQYDKSQVITPHRAYFYPNIIDTDTSTPKPSTSDFLRDLIEDLSPFSMAKKYGRDYIKNYRKYQDFKEVALQYEEKQHKKQIRDDLEHMAKNLGYSPDDFEYTIECEPDFLSASLIHKHFINYEKGELDEMTQATIIGKSYLPNSTTHCIYNATIHCRNGEGEQGVTFYADVGFNIGETVYIRPYLRKKDNKWIYLLAPIKPMKGDCEN